MNTLDIKRELETTLPTSFVLEGFRYYAQGRKCNKAGCRCQDGKLHGSYWYMRDTTTGTRKYIGKELPANVIAVYVALRDMGSNLSAEISNTKLKLRCLRKLQKSESLTNSERVFLKHTGYEDCLV